MKGVFLLKQASHSWNLFTVSILETPNKITIVVSYARLCNTKHRRPFEWNAKRTSVFTSDNEPLHKVLVLEKAKYLVNSNLS
jgi:hypothetical protein